MCGQNAQQAAMFSTVSLERAILGIPMRLGRQSNYVVGVMAINGRA